MFLVNRDLWFDLIKHFSPNDRQSFSRQITSVSRLDTSSADLYPLYSPPSITEGRFSALECTGLVDRQSGVSDHRG